jgi:hypothetical protein
MKIRHVGLGLALAMLSLATVNADVITRLGSSTCTIDYVQVEALVKTEVRFWPMGAYYKRDPYQPYQFRGEWKFSWDGAGSEYVDFAGVLNFGDHYTVTDAGWLGGRSVQTFSGFAHYIHGRADWDSATRTLSYKLLPRDRDDGRASRVTQTAPPTCQPKGRACSVFMDTNQSLESLTLSMTFNETLDRFEGTVIATQFGGSGMTKMQSDTVISVKGELNAI